MARLLGEVCQRRDDVAIVARSPPYATANHDCDGAPYIGFPTVSALDGLGQGIVSHSYSGIEVEITRCIGHRRFEEELENIVLST